MRNTTFFATQEIVDTGDEKVYKVGDQGVAEMCHMFCQRMGRGHVHVERCKYEDDGKQCVEEEGRRHATGYCGIKEALDEVKHSKFWRRQKWKDPCSEKDIKKFSKCNFVCGHPCHKDDDPEDESKYCTGDLWHEPFGQETLHNFECINNHPFTNCHVIFLCDITYSMSDDDKGKSVPHHKFIQESNKLNNRLGALYSAVYNFINARLNSKCIDDLSAIMFKDTATIAASNVKANEQFVKDYLLKYKPGGGTNFYQAFNAAKNLVDQQQNSVLIFLTDADKVDDDGSSDIVKQLSKSMGKRFQLYCIILGEEANKDVVDSICKAGNGTLTECDAGDKIAPVFTNIAKEMTTGVFGKL
eukprot:220550_1